MSNAESKLESLEPFDGSRTIVCPMPGGKAGPQLVADNYKQALYGLGGATDTLDAIGSINPMVSAAANLISLTLPLRQCAQQTDTQRLFTHICKEVDRFERHCAELNLSPDDVLVARYLLCTFVDENILATEWGQESSWASRSLLSHYHNETWGGEKFFDIVDRLLRGSKQRPYLRLLELAYTLLSLGFQGKYRVSDSGGRNLKAIKDQVYETLRLQRGDPEPSLSAQWRGCERIVAPLAPYLPVWSAAAIAAGLLLSIFPVLLYALNTVSDPVAVELASLGKKVPVVTRVAYQPPPLTLTDLLADQIAQQQLQLRRTDAGEIVILQGDDYFRSGRAQVVAANRPVLLSVAAALQQVPGQVLISGHTDSVPIHTRRYPSNWELSRARAGAVQTLLSETLPDERLEIEAKADSEPVAGNDSVAGRARNRRVEILLRPLAGDRT